MKPVRKPLIVIGSANMDLVTRVKRFPAGGETLPGDALEQFPGGKGANQAVAAARAGARVRFIGNIGCGVFGDALIAGLQKEGVDLGQLERSKKLPAGTALILLNEAGENQIVVTRSSNDLVNPAQIRRAKKLIQQAGMVLLQLEVPLSAVSTAISLAFEAKMPVMLNPAPVTGVLPKSLLTKVTWLTPNEHEAAVLTAWPTHTKEQVEASARRLLKMGVANVVVTCGARGACWVTSEGARWFPARRVKAVDTVGAGDCFSGTLAAGLCTGLPPADAISRAVAMATEKVTRKGAQPKVRGK